MKAGVVPRGSAGLPSRPDAGRMLVLAAYAENLLISGSRRSSRRILARASFTGLDALPGSGRAKDGPSGSATVARSSASLCWGQTCEEIPCPVFSPSERFADVQFFGSAALIDCKTSGHGQAARFWAEALGRAVDSKHPNSRGKYRMLQTPPTSLSCKSSRVDHESRGAIAISGGSRLAISAKPVMAASSRSPLRQQQRVHGVWSSFIP